MYNGDGLDEESSNWRYVGMDIGGKGMDCGIGEGGSFEGFLEVVALVEIPFRSSGSGLTPGVMGFLLGDV